MDRFVTRTPRERTAPLPAPKPARVLVQTRIEDCKKVVSKERVATLLQNLQAAVRDDDDTLILRALQAFDTLFVSFEILADTGVGRIVSKLRGRAGDGAVAAKAATLYEAWKKTASDAATRLARQGKLEQHVDKAKKRAAADDGEGGGAAAPPPAKKRKVAAGGALPPAFDAEACDAAMRSLDGGVLLDEAAGGFSIEDEVDAWEAVSRGAKVRKPGGSVGSTSGSSPQGAAVASSSAAATGPSISIGVEKGVSSAALSNPSGFGSASAGPPPPLVTRPSRPPVSTGPPPPPSTGAGAPPPRPRPAAPPFAMSAAATTSVAAPKSGGGLLLLSTSGAQPAPPR